MLRAHFSVATLAAAAFLVGCQTEDPIAPEDTAAPVPAASAGVSTADVVTFADEELVVGSSRLVRNAAGVSYRLSTTGLEPGTAATLWIVIFNEPENCATSPCGEPDLFDPAVVTDVMYGAGSLVGGSGKATFAGHRAVRDESRSLWEVLGLPSPGLLDAREAEIHLIVRTHGPVIAGMARQMTSTFNGGCPRDGLPDDPFIGPEGPNVCEDVHFAVHQP